jgi:hypothetical protein
MTNTIKLPADENDIREKLKEIQDEDGNDYTVLRGEAQFKCKIPGNLDIFEINKKLKKLTGKDMQDLMIISRLAAFRF